MDREDRALPVLVEELTPATLREAQRDAGSDVLVEYYGNGCARLAELRKAAG